MLHSFGLSNAQFHSGVVPSFQRTVGSSKAGLLQKLPSHQPRFRGGTEKQSAFTVTLNRWVTQGARACQTLYDDVKEVIQELVQPDEERLALQAYQELQPAQLNQMSEEGNPYFFELVTPDIHPLLLKVLVDKGLDINQKNDWGRNVLMNRLAQPVEQAETVRADWVLLLVKNGLDVDSVDMGDKTALMLAAQNGHNQAVKALVELNANVDWKDRANQTALLYAAGRAAKQSDPSTPDSVALLVAASQTVSKNDLKQVVAIAKKHGNTALAKRVAQWQVQK